MRGTVEPPEHDLDWIAEDLRGLALEVEELTQDPSNARLHPERNMEALKASLHRFGQRKPVVVRREGMIVIAGNGTLEAARALGWSHLAAVIVEDDATTATGYAIADNRTAELAEWDTRALYALLESVGGELPLTDLGFNEEELEALLEGLPELEEEESPAEDPGAEEPPENPVSEPGKLYELGAHLLLCGDCRSPEAWQELLGEDRVNVVITSPPYASQRKYDESSGFKPIHPDDYCEWWEPLQALVASHLTEDGSFFVNIKEHCEDGQRSLYVKDLVIAHVREWGWRFVDEFCWRNTKNGVPGRWRDRLKNAWEPVLHFSTGGHKFRPTGAGSNSAACFDYDKRNGYSKTGSGFQKDGAPVGGYREGVAWPSNVIECAASSSPLHSAAFPVKLPEFFVKAFTDKGDSVLDPFMGSGTTLIAAARQGRRCYGMEISPAYCDVIRKRWGAWAKVQGVDPGPDAL
jgi:DNA modification methylase